ncbi:MAG TPA: hypothetical protein VF714_11240, partial [Jatrophihabitans sp.]
MSSGNAFAARGSVSSGCATAINDSSASGGECPEEVRPLAVAVPSTSAVAGSEEISAASPAAGTLAFTGLDLTPFLVLGTVLPLLGLLLLTAARRRRRATPAAATDPFATIPDATAASAYAAVPAGRGEGPDNRFDTVLASLGADPFDPFAGTKSPTRSRVRGVRIPDLPFGTPAGEENQQRMNMKTRTSAGVSGISAVIGALIAAVLVVLGAGAAVGQVDPTTVPAPA